MSSLVASTKPFGVEFCLASETSSVISVKVSFRGGSSSSREEISHSQRSITELPVVSNAVGITLNTYKKRTAICKTMLWYVSGKRATHDSTGFSEETSGFVLVITKMLSHAGFTMAEQTTAKLTGPRASE